ncbi:hypothetical protein PI125_g16849 [Phytophthora idaei]|nr:hypothetical protein PI125_g16849 [Phytophthora idaei]
MLQQLRTFAPGTPFKLTALSRLELIAWLKAAWGSLSTAAVINGFRKAKILQHGGPRVLDAPLASLPSQPELEEEGTDREQLFDLVRKHSMERMVLVGGAADPSRDIEALEASVEN